MSGARSTWRRDEATMAKRRGDGIFIGALAMLVAVRLTDLSDIVLLCVALGIGWAINEAERRRSQ